MYSNSNNTTTMNDLHVAFNALPLSLPCRKSANGKYKVKQHICGKLKNERVSEWDWMSVQMNCTRKQWNRWNWWARDSAFEKSKWISMNGNLTKKLSRMTMLHKQLPIIEQTIRRDKMDYKSRHTHTLTLTLILIIVYNTTRNVSHITHLLWWQLHDWGKTTRTCKLY